jgi:ABC-2 type transport system permease protein
MSSTVVAKLVAKDLYMNRWLLGIALIGGVLSLVASGTSRTGFNVGSIFYLTTVIAFGVVLVMYAVVNERKEKSLLFVLSLPLSPAQYLRAKVLAVGSAFGAMWLLLSVGVVAMILLTGVPNGLIPFFAAVAGLMVANFCIVLAAALLTFSEPIVAVAIISTNLSVSMLFVLLSSIPSIGKATEHDVIVWSAPVFWIVGVEAAVAAVALALPFLFPRRSII